MNKKLYYAVNGSGQGCVFATSPARDEHRKIWLGEINGLYCRLVMQMEAEGFVLPPMKWSDEPIEISVNVSINKD